MEAPEVPDLAWVIVADEPFIFPIWPTKYDILCSFLKMVISKFTGDDLHNKINYFFIVSDRAYYEDTILV